MTPEENAALARIDSAVPGIAAAVQWVINDPASGVVALKAELAKIDAATQWAINDPTSGLAALKKELDALKGQISSLPAGSAPAGGTITGTITGTIKP